MVMLIKENQNVFKLHFLLIAIFKNTQYNFQSWSQLENGRQLKSSYFFTVVVVPHLNLSVKCSVYNRGQQHEARNTILN